jgi:hypothetical protein
MLALLKIKIDSMMMRLDRKSYVFSITGRENKSNLFSKHPIQKDKN